MRTMKRESGPTAGGGRPAPTTVAEPERMKRVAEEMVDGGAYAPEGSLTKCNYFVRDFASRVYGYDGFAGLQAAQIVELIARAADGWTPLFDQRQGGSVQPAFVTAQSRANEGYLVVVGLPGHVAVVMPGKLAESKQWRQLAPDGVPMTAQAGASVFAYDKLSMGFVPFGPNDRFVVSVRRAPKPTRTSRRSRPGPRTASRVKPARGRGARNDTCGATKAGGANARPARRPKRR